MENIEEVKCDFLVSNKLKKIQVIQVDLLNELLRVCRKHDIKLTVFAGTMLGAIRHKGFIPWDDDIDVAMTRENFERLQSIAETEFEHPYFFQTAKRDRRFFCAFARLVYRQLRVFAFMAISSTANKQPKLPEL